MSSAEAGGPPLMDCVIMDSMTAWAVMPEYCFMPIMAAAICC